MSYFVSSSTLFKTAILDSLTSKLCSLIAPCSSAIEVENNGMCLNHVIKKHKFCAHEKSIKIIQHYLISLANSVSLTMILKRKFKTYFNLVIVLETYMESAV